jgi:hypothetical protein
VLPSGGASAPLLGYAHSGILTAARWLAAAVGPALSAALAARPGAAVTITGHSMGAGAAVLLTEMLRQRPETAHATCVAFACPAVLTAELAAAAAPYCTTLIAGADIIPTASAAAVADLRGDVAAARAAQRAEARRIATQPLLPGFGGVGGLGGGAGGVGGLAAAWGAAMRSAGNGIASSGGRGLAACVVPCARGRAPPAPPAGSNLQHGEEGIGSEPLEAPRSVRALTPPPPLRRRGSGSGGAGNAAGGAGGVMARACWAARTPGKSRNSGSSGAAATAATAAAAAAAATSGDSDEGVGAASAPPGGGGGSDASGGAADDAESARGASLPPPPRRRGSADDATLSAAAAAATAGASQTASAAAAAQQQPQRSASAQRQRSGPLGPLGTSASASAAPAAPAVRLLFPAGRIMHVVWDANDDDDDDERSATADDTSASASAASAAASATSVSASAFPSPPSSFASDGARGPGLTSASQRRTAVARLPRIEAAEARAPPPWRAPASVRRGRWALYDGVPPERYGRLLLSRRMLLDHFMPTISEHLSGLMCQLGVPAPPSPLAGAEEGDGSGLGMIGDDDAARAVFA